MKSDAKGAVINLWACPMCWKRGLPEVTWAALAMPERLTDRLVELGQLEPAQAEEALDRQVLQGGALDTSLLELGLSDEASISRALEAAYGLEVASPSRALGPAQDRALRILPEPWAKKHMLAPLELAEDGEHLVVLSPGPLDAGLLSRLGELLEVSLVPVLGPEFRVWQRLSRLYDLEPPERFRILIEEHGDVQAPPAEAVPAVEDVPQDVLPTPEAISEATEAALGFSEAVNLLRDAKDRDEIVRTTLRYAMTDLELVAMFINHEDHLEGWMGRGPGTEQIPQLRVNLTPDSAFRVVLDTQAHYLGPIPSDPAHNELLEKTQRPRPQGVLIVPIRIRNRTVALLYGENGSATIPPRLAADLMLFTTHLQMALEGLLMRRKSESLSELRKEPIAPKPQVPPAATQTPWASEVPSQLPVVQTQPGLERSEDTDRGEANPFDEEPLDAPSAIEDAPSVVEDAPSAPAEPAQPELHDSETLQLEAVRAPPEPDTLESLAPEELPEVLIEAPQPHTDEDGGWQDAVVEDGGGLGSSPLLSDDSWAQATLQPAESTETEHPLIGDDSNQEWAAVSTPDFGGELDDSLAAAQGSLLSDDALIFDSAVLSEAQDSQDLLNELDELTSSLEEAVALSEATSTTDPTAAKSDAWDDVDVDKWDDSSVATPTPKLTPIPDVATETNPIARPPADSVIRARARASLTEDATLPDLSAEAWIRASSEIVRPRALPQEVMEAAARPAEPDPVPLTRITIGRQEMESAASADLMELHSDRGDDQRYDAGTTPIPSLDGTVPILLGTVPSGITEPDPIPLTEPSRVPQEEPVPLTQLSTGGYRAEAPGLDDPFGQDPNLYEDHEDEDESSLEDSLQAVEAPVSHLRAVPEATRPVSGVEVRAARIEQDALHWLEQLEHGSVPQQSAAVEALVNIGPEALAYIGDRFPGPLSLDPFLPDAQLPAFTKCGPLLSTLERFGRDAHPYVLKHLDAPSPHHRFFAIYFYGSVYVPEAIPRLIQRLHDEEARTCMLAARTLFSYREHPDFTNVLDHLHGRLSATSAGARRHACYLVGLFRDVTAIPKLISIIERKEKGMADVAEDALAEITKQRLGSVKKWNAWWAKNSARSRIAWLIDGLAARSEELRHSAAEELRAVTGLDMGFDAVGSKRQREDARQRWIQWWRDQERAAQP